jgi:hypothetical protein
MPGSNMHARPYILGWGSGGGGRSAGRVKVGLIQNKWDDELIRFGGC